MNNSIKNNFFDVIGFDDEIDCAIIDDNQMTSTLINIMNMRSEKDISISDNTDDLIDTNIDYSNEIHDPDELDMDADDAIVAEREIMINPYEDDEIIEAAIGDEE